MKECHSSDWVLFCSYWRVLYPSCPHDTANIWLFINHKFQRKCAQLLLSNFRPLLWEFKTVWVGGVVGKPFFQLPLPFYQCSMLSFSDCFECIWVLAVCCIVNVNERVHIFRTWNTAAFFFWQLSKQPVHHSTWKRWFTNEWYWRQLPVFPGMDVPETSPQSQNAQCLSKLHKDPRATNPIVQPSVSVRHYNSPGESLFLTMGL